MFRDALRTVEEFVGQHISFHHIAVHTTTDTLTRQRIVTNPIVNPIYPVARPFSTPVARRSGERLEFLKRQREGQVPLLRLVCILPEHFLRRADSALGSIVFAFLCHVSPENLSHLRAPVMELTLGGFAGEWRPGAYTFQNLFRINTSPYRTHICWRDGFLYGLRFSVRKTEIVDRR